MPSVTTAEAPRVAINVLRDAAETLAVPHGSLKDIPWIPAQRGNGRQRY